MSEPAVSSTETALASAWRATLDNASPRTATTSGATAASILVRIGPSKLSVGRNFRVVAARSTMRVTSAWMSLDSSSGTESEDRAPDVADRRVEVVDRDVEPRLDLGTILERDRLPAG